MYCGARCAFRNRGSRLGRRQSTAAHSAELLHALWPARVRYPCLFDAVRKAAFYPSLLKSCRCPFGQNQPNLSDRSAPRSVVLV